MNKYIGIEGNRLRMKIDWEKPELYNPRHYRLRAAYEDHLASLPVIQAEFEVEIGREYVEGQDFKLGGTMEFLQTYFVFPEVKYRREIGTPECEQMIRDIDALGPDSKYGYREVSPVALPISKQEANPEVSKEGEMVEKKRYFIVFYSANIPTGIAKGEVNITCYNGYLNRWGTMADILEASPEMSSLVFTNIIELSKRDYEAWAKKPAATPSPSPTIKSAEACGVCGSAKVFIRGKYPKQDKRLICPTCAYEILEQINEMSSPNRGIASTASQFRDSEPSK